MPLRIVLSRQDPGHLNFCLNEFPSLWKQCEHWQLHRSLLNLKAIHTHILKSLEDEFT